MSKSFLSSEGSIGRLKFTLSLIALIALTAGIGYGADYFFTHPDYFMHGHFGTLGRFCAIIGALICSMIGLMQLLKRLRDMGKEAYWTLWMLVPGLNCLVLLYACVAPSKRA
jgi:uncharacterized membrane protein YhaH (DUF805 family)